MGQLHVEVGPRMVKGSWGMTVGVRSGEVPKPNGMVNQTYLNEVLG